MRSELRVLDVVGELTLTHGQRVVRVSASGSAIAIDVSDWSWPALGRLAVTRPWARRIHRQAFRGLLDVATAADVELRLTRNQRIIARRPASRRTTWLGRVLGIPHLRWR